MVHSNNHPPLDMLDPISDSSWDSLSDTERSDLLRKREAMMLARHMQLVDGQKSITMKVEKQGTQLKIASDATRMLSKRLDEKVEPLLKENTEATVRTEGKVDKLIESTATMVSLFSDIGGATRLAGRLAEVGKKLAWFVVPSGALYGAYHAFLAWMKTGGPK